MFDNLPDSFGDINKLEKLIMQFVEIWVHQQKTPIPKKEIIISMTSSGVNIYTISRAISALVVKGYIRKGYSPSNKTIYVQLRRI